jgi:hypothetical protein
VAVGRVAGDPDPLLVERLPEEPLVLGREGRVARVLQEHGHVGPDDHPSLHEAEIGQPPLEIHRRARLGEVAHLAHPRLEEESQELRLVVDVGLVARVAVEHEIEGDERPHEEEDPRDAADHSATKTHSLNLKIGD